MASFDCKLLAEQIHTETHKQFFYSLCLHSVEPFDKMLFVLLCVTEEAEHERKDGKGTESQLQK